MAAPHTDVERIEEHSSFIQTPKQLVVVILLAFAVPVAVILLLAKLVMTWGHFDAEHPAMTDEAIAQRIKPSGQLHLRGPGDPEPPVAAPVAAAPAGTPAAAVPPVAAAPGAAPPAAEKVAAGPAGGGKALYDTACMVCHAAGIAGAPKAGDKAAWAPRLQQGMEALYAASIKGKGAMPPKGGAMQASDADVKAAVDYLVGLAK